MKRISLTWLAFVMLFVLMSTVQAQSPQETFTQYISDLQKNPNDNALREKIIKLAQEIKPAPAIPEEAREHYVMAATFVEKAKDNSGYERAIEQYKAALLSAPWWADAYKKLAISQKAAAHYDDAIASLNLYILTQPADARDAQDEIYKLKALKQSATEDQVKKQGEEQQREARKRSENDYLSGRWKFQGGNEFDKASHAEFHLEGEMLVQEIIFDQNCEIGRAGERREWERWRKVSDKVFQRRNDVQGTDITLEFDGNTIIQTLVKWGSKRYWKKE